MDCPKLFNPLWLFRPVSNLLWVNSAVLRILILFLIDIILKSKKMKNNEILRADVEKAIKWEPLLNASEIGVTAQDGIITLTGTVNNFSQKRYAEDAARSVLGVKVVVEKIEVQFISDMVNRTDNEIASEIVNAYKMDYAFPENKVQAKVENGWVILSGEVNWNYQKDNAKSTVIKLGGVKGVVNDIKIAPSIAENVEKKDVEAALKRNWSIEADKIDVKVSGKKVTLKGRVNSWYQKVEAGKLAWNAPGVSEVENDLVIDYD
jgi:osmotically-inducible protein OsmY